MLLEQQRGHKTTIPIKDMRRITVDRKISKFTVGEEITTIGKIKNWAIGNDAELRTEKIYSITEDQDGITYKTHQVGTYKEDSVCCPADAKKIALKFLAERMIIISASEDSKCQQP